MPDRPSVAALVEDPPGQNATPNEVGECITVAKTHQPQAMASGRAPSTSGASASSNQNALIKSAKAAVATLNKGGSINANAKKDIAALLESMIQCIENSMDNVIEVLPIKSSSHSDNRLDSLERKIDELKTAIMGGRTYAQAVTAGTATPTPATAVKRQQLQLGNKERAAVEVALSASGASGEVQQQIGTGHPKDITAKFQHAVDMTDSLSSKPRILGINKQGKTNNVRLQFKTPAEAQQVKEADVDWSLAFEGVQTHKPQYGIVVHGVATEEINLSEDYSGTAKAWEAQNDIKIVRITTLRRQAKHHPVAHRSLIVFTNSAEAANRCIKRGFFIEHLHHRTERYAPHLHINQCYKCHGFRHRSTTCRQKQRCGKCGQDNHLTKECSNAEHQCVNCKGEHESWHKECPSRMEENRRLNILRLESSPFFA